MQQQHSKNNINNQQKLDYNVPLQRPATPTILRQSANQHANKQYTYDSSHEYVPEELKSKPKIPRTPA